MMFLHIALAMASANTAHGQSPVWIDRWGTQCTTVSVPGGDVVIYLPSDFRAGEKISGSMFAEGAGADTSRDRNAEAIQRDVLIVNGQRFPVGSSNFTIDLLSDAIRIGFSIEAEGRSTSEFRLP